MDRETKFCIVVLCAGLFGASMALTTLCWTINERVNRLVSRVDAVEQWIVILDRQ
jgi:hypothetical protein